jgi:peptide-methionine (R)-S-oxide reductase
MSDDTTYPVSKTDEEWQRELTPEQYAVLRKHATEPRGMSPLNREKRPGTFACAGCGQPLFDASTKYESGTGWPSFYAPLSDAIETETDRSHFMVRTEVHCKRCGGHLGHLFPDGPVPTGQRYCMNGIAMKFQAMAEPDRERAAASEPRERSGDRGVPASERVGGAAGAEPPGGNE